MKKNILIIFCISIFVLSLSAEQIGNITGLKLPRYVSLKSNESNLRIGPSINYPIKITYNVANIPVEIIDEYKNWRKIIDYEKNIGWVHKSLLKGNRFAIVNPPYAEGVQIYTKPKGNINGKIGKKNIVKVNKCLIEWCYINFNQNNGWIKKSNLWGIYQKEIFNIPFYQSILNKFW